jgi:hypothetical protein
MERGVALIARVVAQRDGQIELERLVTLEMAERMRREAEAEADGGVEQGQVARVQKAMEPKKHSQTSGPVSRKKGSDVE